MQPSRPYMPGYGVADDAAGLLPWEWAVERLTASRYYWLATVWPDGRPQVTPLWGVWHDGAVWVSCSAGGRKARNLAADPRCVVTTEDPREPVVVEGVAVSRRDDAEVFVRLLNAKYDTNYEAGFFAENALYAVTPERAFGMVESAFATSPTRWHPPR